MSGNQKSEIEECSYPHTMGKVRKHKTIKLLYRIYSLPPAWPMCSEKKKKVIWHRMFRKCNFRGRKQREFMHQSEISTAMPICQ